MASTEKSTPTSTLKRAVDVAVAIGGIAALGLPGIAIAALIKLEDAGPVFYRGERVGRYGKPFRIFKFRSMRVQNAGPSTTSANDDRITAIGRVLRRFKLDEVPQLLNVLFGDMSLVGPRPDVKESIDRYPTEAREIFTLRPGMTDWASIKFHNEGEIVAASGIADPDEAYYQLIWPEKVRLQLEYAQNHGTLTDLRILWTTVATLVKTRSASASVM